MDDSHDSSSCKTGEPRDLIETLPLGFEEESALDEGKTLKQRLDLLLPSDVEQLSHQRRDPASMSQLICGTCSSADTLLRLQ